MGTLFEYLGFFAVMLICSAIAIKTAKMRWHIVGSVFTFLSLVGLSASNKTNSAQWTLFVVILIVGIVCCLFKNKD